MRIAFAGTPEFASTALRVLIAAGHTVVLVLTRPDRPAGRGMRLLFSPVKAIAVEHQIPVHQPPSLKPAAAQAPLAEAGVEVLVVAAYGLILPPSVLALPRYGCLNIHASLLPRWRGAAPIQRAILAGDAETGISIMQMEAGLDTGPVLLARSLPIAGNDTGGTLTDKLAKLGANLIVEALAGMAEGKLAAVRQPDAGVTYAQKLTKAEAEIHWAKPAQLIERQVRAFNPFPVARTRLRGDTLLLWQAGVDKDCAGRPGEVVRADARGILVTCGEGGLVITELQKASGKRLSAAAFLAGSPVRAGEILGESP